MLAGRSVSKKKKVVVTSPRAETDSDGEDIPCGSFRDGVPVVPQQEVTHVAMSASKSIPSVLPPQPMEETSEGEEPPKRKRRRLIMGKGIATGDERASEPRQEPRPAFIADVIRSGRSVPQRRDATDANPAHILEGGSSAAIGGAGIDAKRAGPEAAPGDINRLTRDLAYVGMTAGRSNRRIMIPGGYNLIESSEQAAAHMTLLCADAEREMLKGVSERDLSRRVAGAAL